MPKFQSDPKPEVVRIEELVRRVKIGDIKLPKFQRPFIWKRNECIKLWDSIYNGYPIGSMLLWLTNQRLASEQQIGGLPIADRDSAYPTNYLLDGQQRLSTLCGALYWDGTNKESMWNICFDLRHEKFLFPKDVQKIEYFPLNKLLETADFLKQCKTFEALEDRDLFFEKAEGLLRAVKDYKIAAVTIGDMKISEVAPIFERINSTGRKLTIYDLMRAATWKDGFDLNNTVQTIRSSLEVKSFEKVPETHILRNISATLGLGINKSDVESLRDQNPDKLKLAADDCVITHMYAVDFLTAQLPISSYDYLPYALQLTYLVEFFRLKPEPSFDQRNKLTTWFWRTSIGRYFASSNTAQIANDLEKMRKFALGEEKDFEIDEPINVNSVAFSPFSLSTAISKTFGLLLAQNKPLSLIDGSKINTHKALATKNRHEYHHIFPQAFLKSKETPKEKIDQLANICLLSKGNNLSISNKAPSFYFGELAQHLGDQLETVLASNFISMDAYNAGLEDNYELFIDMRSKTLIEAARLLANLPHGKEAENAPEFVAATEFVPDDYDDSDIIEEDE